jgi:hypothetical protein
LLMFKWQRLVLYIFFWENGKLSFSVLFFVDKRNR